METPYSQFGTLYRLEQELGSGGGGVVYLAWNTHLQKHVVIKELKRGTKESVGIQRNEVEALKNVKSRYLPQVLDFFVENGRVFTVMEFISGVSFDKLLARGFTCTQQQIVKWYSQLASALEVIHSHNIAHRDIKPANIMLLPNDDVCLIDFNAALVGGNDVTIISRSLGYASPEQYDIFERYRHNANAPIRYTASDSAGRSAGSSASGRNTFIDPSVTGNINWKLSDIYSLGATMYHLLTGVHPPERAADTRRISELGNFDEGLVYIIESSMKYSPYERIPSAEALCNALHNIYRYNSRWKRLQARQTAASIILPVVFAACALTTYAGYNRMQQEKEEEYYSIVYSIQDSADPLGEFEEAAGMFDRADPYYALAKRYWSDGDLDGCMEFIQSSLGSIAKYQDDESAAESLGGIYYILGDCYYYNSSGADYINALENYGTALDYSPENPIYHRDYAITLAKLGKTDEARSELERAGELDLDEVSVALLNGEIEFADGNYASALSLFSDVTAKSTDEYIRYRAYHSMDDIYKLNGQPEDSIPLLTAALQKIPLSRIPEMKERLADAYYQSGDYQSAIDLFVELVGSNPTFIMQQNLAILYQQTDQFDKAAEMLAGMRTQYPGDYRVPMRQAFLQIDVQAQRDIHLRDYARTLEFYEQAKSLYNSGTRNDPDPEMQQLETLIRDLDSMGWIK